MKNTTFIRNVIECILSTGLPILGMLMLWFGLSGAIDFGTGPGRTFNSILYMFAAIAMFALSQLFIGNTWKRRIWCTIAVFVGGVIMLIALGTFSGMMSASEAGVQYNFSNMFAMLDVHTIATADLSAGLNAKLIADSICTLIPALTLAIIIFQILYAGESDEFIKAFIEAWALLMIIIAYNLVGGIAI